MIYLYMLAFLVLFFNVHSEEATKFNCAPEAGECISDVVTRFLLIRHGETEWNVAGKLQGHSNTSLNEVGRQQAKHVAHLLVDNKEIIDVIYSSDLARAYETAHEISRLLDLTIITHTSLRERNAGDAEGMTPEEFARVYGAAVKELDEKFTDRRERWHHNPVPNAETIAQVIARIEHFIKTAASQHRGKTIVGVTHGAVLRNLIIHTAGVVHSIPNCCIVEFLYSHKNDLMAFVDLRKISLH